MPLDTFVEFAAGSDVVIHESVGSEHRCQNAENLQASASPDLNACS